MLMDKQNLLSDQQAVTVTAFSTNVIDLGATGTNHNGETVLSDPGRGDVEVEIQVTEQFTAAGAGTLNVDLVMADDAALTVNKTVIRSSGAIGKATLAPGYRFRIAGKLPPGVSRQYLGLEFTVATGPMTAGKVVSGIVLDRQTAF